MFLDMIYLYHQINPILKGDTIMGFDVEKMIDVIIKVREDVKVNEVEFMSLIATAIDEFCAENHLNTNKVWDDMYTAHKDVQNALGDADYINM